VITAVGAYLYGPGRLARGVRATADRGTTAAGRALESAGMRTGATGRWLAGHRAWTTGGVIAAGALALLLWNRPSVGTVALVLGIVLVVLVVLIVLAVVAAAAGPAARQEERAASP
jgi:asparagine N-glycosylation enzyme membrane subunit Stt3